MKNRSSFKRASKRASCEKASSGKVSAENAADERISARSVRKRAQIAALPIRRDETGAPLVMLITSRETRRWVVPKGWPMKGRKPWDAAGIEAEEEAGVRGAVSSDALGDYDYDKIMDDGRAVPCRVTLYPMVVETTLSRWKERAERTRLWFSPQAAAEAVDEAGLRTLLKRLAKGKGLPEGV